MIEFAIATAAAATTTTTGTTHNFIYMDFTACKAKNKATGIKIRAGITQLLLLLDSVVLKSGQWASQYEESQLRLVKAIIVFFFNFQLSKFFKQARETLP